MINLTPLFSIIIPLYNKARYVEATLSSITAQNLTDFEVIVVDDGSTDGSCDIVMHLAERDNRVRLLRQANGGVSHARNTGIRAAKGTWIAFLDADDTWDSDYLQQMYELILRHPNENLFCCTRHGRPLTMLPQECIIDDCAAWSIIFWTGTTIVRRTMFELVAPFREGISRGEDRDVWLRLGLATPAVLLNRELAHYTEDADGSLTATIPLEKEFPYWEWYNLPTRYPNSLRQYATNQLIALARTQLQLGHRFTALRLVMRCRGFSDLRARINIMIHSLCPHLAWNRINPPTVS